MYQVVLVFKKILNDFEVDARNTELHPIKVENKGRQNPARRTNTGLYYTVRINITTVPIAKAFLQIGFQWYYCNANLLYHTPLSMFAMLQSMLFTVLVLGVMYLGILSVRHSETKRCSDNASRRRASPQDVGFA